MEGLWGIRAKHVFLSHTCFLFRDFGLEIARALKPGPDLCSLRDPSVSSFKSLLRCHIFREAFLASLSSQPPISLNTLFYLIPSIYL